MIIKCVIFSLFLIVPFSLKEDYYAFHFFHVVSCRRTCVFIYPISNVIAFFIFQFQIESDKVRCIYCTYSNNLYFIALNPLVPSAPFLYSLETRNRKLLFLFLHFLYFRSNETQWSH